jgi:predicted nucleotidyltransferase
VISKETIDEVKNRLVKTYNPVAIYLFGSYAWGTPTEDSDLDLLIVVDTSDERAIKRSLHGYKALWGLEIAKDILVYTSDEFKTSSQKEASLPHKIKHYGKVIYARACAEEIPALAETQLAIKHAQSILSFVIKKIEEPETGQTNVF